MDIASAFKTEVLKPITSVRTLAEQIQLITEIRVIVVATGPAKQLIQWHSFEHRQAQDL